jgi:hypothetical protein
MLKQDTWVCQRKALSVGEAVTENDPNSRDRPEAQQAADCVGRFASGDIEENFAICVGRESDEEFVWVSIEASYQNIVSCAAGKQQSEVEKDNAVEGKA